MYGSGAIIEAVILSGVWLHPKKEKIRTKYINNILKTHFNGANISVDEIALPIKENNLYLPCGVTGWIANE